MFSHTYFAYNLNKITHRYGNNFTLNAINFWLFIIRRSARFYTIVLLFTRFCKFQWKNNGDCIFKHKFTSYNILIILTVYTVRTLHESHTGKIECHAYLIAEYD